jgi:hypothetical protein
MRRISTCLLLLVFLLYQAGFYLFYLAQKRIIDYKMEASRDLLMGETNLIVKSIPISFPYQSDQEEYQPVMRVIEDNGKFYRVVMQRYAKDTLHIMYIADKDNQSLHTSLKEWVNTISQQSSHDKKMSVKDGLEKNYIPYRLVIDLSNFFRVNNSEYYQCIPEVLVNPLEKLTPPPKS